MFDVSFRSFVLTTSAESLAIGSVESIGSDVYIGSNVPTKFNFMAPGLCPVVHRASGIREDPGICGAPEVCGAAGVRDGEALGVSGAPGVRRTFRTVESPWSAKSIGCEDSFGSREFPASEGSIGSNKSNGSKKLVKSYESVGSHGHNSL